LVGDDRVALLAADLPFLTAEVLHLLDSRVVGEADGALLVDPGGRDQLLAGVWRTASLRAALAAAGPPEGQALGRLVRAMTVVRVPADAVPPGAGEPWRDCDTPEDIDTAEELA
jgi:molybdopterin-guanine dinucleotide biosynthesis protein A